MSVSNPLPLDLELILTNLKHAIGLCPNQNLLKFISAATGGMYILMDTETVKNWPPPYWSKYRSSDDVMNPIARGSFCWGFQKGLNCSKYLPQTDSYWDVADMCVRGWHQNECLTYPVETANNKEIILFQRDYHKIRVGLQLEKVIECHLRQVFKQEVTFSNRKWLFSNRKWLFQTGSDFFKPEVTFFKPEVTFFKPEVTFQTENFI